MACAYGGVFISPVLQIKGMQSEIRSCVVAHDPGDTQSPGRPSERAGAPLVRAGRWTRMPSVVLRRVRVSRIGNESARWRLRRGRARTHGGGIRGAEGKVRMTWLLGRTWGCRVRVRWSEEVIVLAGILDQCLCLYLYRRLASRTVRVRCPCLRQLSGSGTAVAVVRLC